MEERDATRRDFLWNGAATTAALLAAGTTQTSQSAELPAQHQHEGQARQGHEHKQAHPEYPRDHAGLGGPVGSATDRGKLVPGFRAPGLPPVPVLTPDVAKLPWKLVGGVKEFHLHARHTRREFLPGEYIDVWGYNDSIPGPTMEAVQGDRVRVVLHNELPEPTTLHLHGMELPNLYDGVHGVTQDPIMPGQAHAYELTLHQNGTYIYHSHGPMQEGMGMAGLFIIHPPEAYLPPVDHDFGLLIQEFAILPQSSIPNTTSMEFNWFTLNGRSGPYVTPLLVRLGSRVRIRMVNMSPIDHHPMHIHGHTFWVTGGDGGRYPESAWLPANTTLVGVAQSRDIEFIANNPGDWVLHCHMFHHMMNHMTVMVGPMARHMHGMPAGKSAQSGMGMTQGGHALSEENGPSLGRAMGEQTSNERSVRTGSHTMSQHSGHGGGDTRNDPRYRVPGYPQDMMDMHGMLPEADLKKLAKPETRGMRRDWFAGVEALHTIVRVLPPDLYDKVVSGKGDIAPGASVPGSTSGMQHMHEGHQHSEMKKDGSKDGTKSGGQHEHHD
jgi:FtsP/CotA-like multicopper oxidase with cupredoxin domain